MKKKYSKGSVKNIVGINNTLTIQCTYVIFILI